MAAVALVLSGGVVFASSGQTASGVFPGPVPPAKCGPGSLPEQQQGRVPQADVASGRAALGYTCNAFLVSHISGNGAYKVQRYVDQHGRQCAYYDSARTLPPQVTGQGVGTSVVDMSDPTKPVVTDVLRTPAMLNPHETLLVNQGRGLLVASMGSRGTAPGFVDVYQLADDCRHPTLATSLPVGVLGHESGFAPDGRTYYVTPTVAPIVSAISLDNPQAPVPLGAILGHDIHGMSVSDDGRLLYATEIAPQSGLTIFDVSQVQDRAPAPQITQVASLTWPDGSIPLTTMPFTVSGHQYLLETDEYTALPPAMDQVGAARIIDVADPKHPFVVSNIRLWVHMHENRQGSVAQDDGATSATGGYSGHYCSLPRRVEPGIVACAFIKSGVRVIDIRDPAHPAEIAYFNKPPANGTSDDVSTIAFDPAHQGLWYSDGVTGFWAIRLADSVWQPHGSYPNPSG